MKKILLILLIAVAASVKIDFDDTELHGKFLDFLKRALNFIINVCEKIKKFFGWFQAKGYTKDLLVKLEKYGPTNAIDFCIQKTGQKGLCKEMTDKIFDYIRKNK